MAEFQVFSLIKTHLLKNMESQSIYFTFHPEMKKPCCIIELEEMWSNTITLQRGGKKFD